MVKKNDFNLSIGDNFLGFYHSGYRTIELYGDFKTIGKDKFFPLSDSEVRLVASLRVKSIK